MIEILREFYPAFLSGIWVTFQLTFSVWIIGIVIGAILGVIASKSNFIFGNFIWGLSTFVLSIPVLVLLFWFHYPFQAIIDQVFDPKITTIFTLSILNILGVSEITRKALISFPREYIHSGLTCGMKSSFILWKIQIPLIIRQVAPQIIFLQVTMLHASLFASLISVNETFRVAQNINSMVYRPVEVYSFVAIFFLIISLPLNVIGIWLERKNSKIQLLLR